MQLEEEFDDLDKKFISTDGANYKGDLDSRGRKNGKGCQKWPDGSMYVGEWKNNKAHGTGEFWHANGDHFQGEFEDDKAHGEGKYTHANGSVYEGDWV